MRILLALVIVAAVALGGCGRGEEQGAVSRRDRPLPDQVISDFEITETSEGKRDWMMEAEKAYIYDKRNLLEAEIVEVTFFGKDGEVRSVLRADYGKLNRATDDIEARGGVVVTNEEGVELRSETLRWESTSREIASDDSVTVIRDRDVLTGWGFRGDPDLGSFRILRDMRATIRSAEELMEEED
jgi:LPS export ABC transporter protein LptC